MSAERIRVLERALHRLVIDYQDVPDPTDADAQAVFADARAALAHPAPARELSEAVRSHVSDSDGERCIFCGERGWASDAACSGREQPAPAPAPDEARDATKQLLFQKFDEAYALGVAAERERCAKVCEDGYFQSNDSPAYKFGQQCAAAIRRGE